MASIQHFPTGELAEKGLLLQSGLPIADPGAQFVGVLAAAGVDLGQFKTPVMVGQAGPLLFDDVVANHLDDPDPFGSVSVSLVTDWVKRKSPQTRLSVLYPDPNHYSSGLKSLWEWLS